MRSLPLVVVMLAVVVAGCVHSGHALRFGEEVSPPKGLDSVGVAKWVVQQRAACPGRLNLLFDEGGNARDFDTSVVPHQSPGSPAPYEFPFSVTCIRP